MARPKKQGYEKTTINMRTDLKTDIREKYLPHEGAQDLGSFIELACEHEIKRIREERRARPRP